MPTLYGGSVVVCSDDCLIGLQLLRSGRTVAVHLDTLEATSHKLWSFASEDRFICTWILLFLLCRLLVSACSAARRLAVAAIDRYTSAHEDDAAQKQQQQHEVNADETAVTAEATAAIHSMRQVRP